jgi:signal peptide peptidase SppA
MLNVWAGSGDSISNYLALAEKYEASTSANHELFQAYQNRYDDDEDGLDPVFGVQADRIGLSYLERIGNTAVLNINGSLVNAHSWWHAYAKGSIMSYDAVRDAVSILRGSDEVSRVIIRVSSGGGMVAGLETAAKSLNALKLTRNTVVHVETTACSAAYWLSAGAGAIYADSMANIGNIGTMALLPDFSAAYAKEGIKFHLFKAGKEKGYGIPQVEFTEEEKQYFQGYVEKTNNFFLTHVSRARNLLISDTDKWAEAQTFFAGEAYAVGLIDKVASLEEVIGSLTASTNNGDTGMTISEEKLALISAGAAPETVLTTAELAAYNTTLESTDAIEPEAKAEEPAVVAEESTPADELVMAKQVGKLEAQLEASATALAAQKELADALQVQTDSLLVVAQAAVGNLQVALQKPKETKATAAELLAQYNDLHSEMASRFKPGRTSASAQETASLDVKPKIQHPIRPY